MIICKECKSIAYFNSYFGCYICSHCQSKNYNLDIFVDSNYFPYKNMSCCHLFPGKNCTIEKFVEFAITELGLKREWLQYSNKEMNE